MKKVTKELNIVQQNNGEIRQYVQELHNVIEKIDRGMKVGHKQVDQQIKAMSTKPQQPIQIKDYQE